MNQANTTTTQRDRLDSEIQSGEGKSCWKMSRPPSFPSPKPTPAEREHARFMSQCIFVTKASQETLNVTSHNEPAGANVRLAKSRESVSVLNLTSCARLVSSAHTLTNRDLSARPSRVIKSRAVLWNLYYSRSPTSRRRDTPAISRCSREKHANLIPFTCAYLREVKDILLTRREKKNSARKMLFFCVPELMTNKADY